MSLRIQINWRPQVLVSDLDSDRPAIKIPDRFVGQIGFFFVIAMYDEMFTDARSAALEIETLAALRDVGRMFTKNEQTDPMTGAPCSADFHERVLEVVKDAARRTEMK